jgi:hypothetical protein
MAGTKLGRLWQKVPPQMTVREAPSAVKENAEEKTQAKVRCQRRDSAKS